METHVYGSWQKIFRTAVLFLVFLVLGNGLFIKSADAAPIISDTYQTPENPCLLWYVRRLDGEITDSTMEVNGKSASVDFFGDTSQLENVVVRTVILLDNSLSINETNREKAKDLIKGLIQNHFSNEEFIIYTFAEDLTEIGRGSDYTQLSEAIDEIKFENQDSFLASCITDVLKELSEDWDKASSIDRMILISDGADDNTSGPSFYDVLDMMEDEVYRTPVYTVASIWDKDKGGLKDLSSLARKSDALSFGLDEYDEASTIIDQIQKDSKTVYFNIYVPLEEKDGTAKTVTLNINTTAGQEEVSKRVVIPERTPEEEEEYQASLENEKTTEEEEEEETNKSRVIVIENYTNDSAASEAEDDNFFEKYRLLLIFGVLLLLAGIAWLVIMMRHRKRSRVWNEDNHNNNPKDNAAGMSSGVMPGTPETISNDNTIGEGGTISIWAVPKSAKKVCLVQKEPEKKSYEIVVADEVVVGRSKKANLILEGDRMVSKQHFRLFVRNNNLMIEDLASTNGTFLNKRRLVGAQSVQQNDQIRVGSIELEITYTDQY